MVPARPRFIGRPGCVRFERLDLALLVAAEHQGVLGRVQVQAHDVDQLVLEARVARELEGAAAGAASGRCAATRGGSVVAPTPRCSASVRVLQCVAVDGLVVQRRVARCATPSRPSRSAGAPSAAHPCAAPRCRRPGSAARHSATWRRSSSTSTAMSLFCQPLGGQQDHAARAAAVGPRRACAWTGCASSRSVCASSSIVSATRIAPASWAIRVCRRQLSSITSAHYTSFPDRPSLASIGTTLRKLHKDGFMVGLACIGAIVLLTHCQVRCQEAARWRATGLGSLVRARVT